MKILSPIFYIVLLVINLIAGFILSAYPTFNMAFNSVVFLITMFFALWINGSHIHSAFKISLSFILPLFALIEFVLGCFAPAHIHDNWAIILVLSLMVFEWVAIYTVIKCSEKSAK